MAMQYMTLLAQGHLPIVTRLFISKALGKGLDYGTLVDGNSIDAN